LHDTSWSDKLSLYEDWYNADMPNLFGYLVYHTQDRELAQDITAATCLQALERLDQYDPSRSKLKNWIFGIAKNQLYDHLRSQKRQPIHIALSSIAEHLITDSGLEPDYDRRETFLEVLSHLEDLSEREKEVIALRYGAGLSNAEIASMLELSGNHIAVLHNRAIEKLREKAEARVYNVS